MKLGSDPIAAPVAQRFEALLEAAPDAIVIVDTGGTVRIVNGEAERLFGYERSELIGSSIEILVPERARGNHASHRLKYCEDPRKRTMGIGLDLTARRKDGSELPVEISLSPLGTDDSMLVISAIRDISERRRFELALSESERRFREFVEGTDDLVVRVDPGGRFLYLNHTAERVFGLPPEECVGLLALDFVHPDDRDRTEESFARLTGGGAPSDTIENRQIARNGDVTHLLWTVNPRRDERGTLTSITSIARDISDRKRLEMAERRAIEAKLQLQSEQMESQLRREVLRRSIAAQEDERRRIARELHDETAQTLTGLSLGLGRVEAASDLAAAQAEAKRLGEEVIHTMRELRRIAMDLRPTTLDDLGLIVALEHLVEECQVGTVEFAHPGFDRRLEGTLETTIYRVVQEALTNAARHAAAEAIRVRLAEEDGIVVASVSDDGRGFDPAADPAQGLGLGGMRERAGLVDGELKIESAPGSGTTIELRVRARAA